MQLATLPVSFFKLGKSPVYYTVVLARQPPANTPWSKDRSSTQGAIAYMDVVEASCVYQAVFLTLYHYFSDYLALHWQDGRYPLSPKQLIELDLMANSFAYTAFLRIGTRRQRLYPSVGAWYRNQGPCIEYGGIK